MAMPCPEKMAQLPIDDRYKQAIAAFCSDPQNESACQLLCDAPPDVIVQKFEQVENELASYVEEGVPPDLAAVAQQQAPEFAQMANQFLQEKGPDILAQERSSRQPQGFARGGLASLGRFGDRNIAHVQKGEMVVPNHVLNDTPGLRAELSALMARRGADPARYTVGGRKASYNPRTGQQEFFSLGGVIGGVVGFAVGGPVGAAIGAGAGTMVDTGDPVEALGMAAGAYGLAGAGIGMGLWGEGTVGYGAGLTGYWTAPGSTALGGMFAAAPEAVAGGAQAMQYTGPAFIGTEGQTIATGSLMTPEIAATEGIAMAELAPASTQQLMAGQVATYGGDVAGTSFLGTTPQSLGAAATTPAVTPPAPPAPGTGTTGSTSLWDKAKGWWGDSSTLEKMGALSVGSSLLGATGMLDAEQPQRPPGYDLQTDPSAQYGGKEYETLQPGDLFANIDQYGSGVPGSPGTPIGGVGTPTVASSGYSYGSVPTYGSTPATYGSPYSIPSYATIRVADGGHVRGPGTATSDSIPAYLSDGEFVMTTKAVRGAGNGSLRDGARRLYAMMDELERRA